MTRYRIDGTSAAVGIPVAAYMIVLSLFALWFYSLLQPRYTPNPGLVAYKPPPATVYFFFRVFLAPFFIADFVFVFRFFAMLPS
jgi:hypothetical protein